MKNRVGQQLGNYRLTRLLGSGGFADVYLGEHVYLDTQQAAIKVLHTQLSHKDNQKFLAEARLLTRLVHPGIVRLLDFALEGNTPFLVMDYAPNGTLRQRHPRGTKLPLTTIIPYVIQIAQALQYIHQNHKLVHRDIKPENLFLGRQNEVLLGDFGITILTRSVRTESSEERAGTQTYIAPEQIQGRSRRASDQYALGIVIYEWLSGDVPFKGPFHDVINQHLYSPPPPFQEKGLTLPHSIEQIVMKALEKDPKKRFASIWEFAQALNTAWEHIEKVASKPTVREELSSHKTKEQWLRKGIAHYNMKQYGEAIKAYNSAVELAPTYTLAYALRGQAYACLKDFQRAVRDFDFALKLDPSLIWVQIDREQAYRQLRKIQQAL